MKPNTISRLLIGSLLAGLSGLSNAAVFEDFSKTISSNKFAFRPAVERTLELDTVNQKLTVSEKGRGYTQNFRNVWASLVDPTGNMIQADLNLSEVTLSSSGTQQAFIGIAGQFYNSSSATPTNDIGEVWVRVSIGDRGNGLEAWYEVQESTASDFATANYTIASLGSVSLNTTYTASIAYDGNQTFTIVFNNGTAISVPGPARLGGSISQFRAAGSSVRFGQDNSTPSDLDDKLADGGLPVSVAGTIDNVTTDIAGLVDDFSGTNLDQAKWANDQFSKEIVSGVLVMKATGQGAQKTESLWPNKFPLRVFGATVKLLSSSTINNTTQIRARLAHYLSNDTFDVLNGATADGNTGTIWTQFVIRRNGGANSAFVHAERAQNTDWSVGDQLFFIDVTPTAGINLDQDYVLLIEKTGTLVEYKLDGVLVHSFDLATDHGTILSGNDFTPVRDEVIGQASGIQARVQSDAGVVHASFDDIVTDHVPQELILSAFDQDDEETAYPAKVIVHEDEVVDLIAKVDDPADILVYLWEQESGPDVTAARGTTAAKTIGTEQSFSFKVPENSNKETLEFKVTLVDNAGVESSQQFSLEVDNSETSTFTGDDGKKKSGGGGSSPLTLLIALFMLFGFARQRRS